MWSNVGADALFLLFLFTCCLHTLYAANNDKSSSKYIDKTVVEGEAHLTDDDFRNIEQQEKRPKRQSLFGEQSVDLDEEGDVDDSAMYNSARFEGDIVSLVNPKLNGADEDQIDTNQSRDQGAIMRNAVRQSYLKWPGGRIPYTISTQYTSFGRARIASAIQEYQDKTCIRFVPKVDADLDYVHILPEEGCYSMVGKTGGKQPVSIGNGCILKGIIIHELMHSVGFFHEQSRADRDQYIKIIWSNVETGLEDQFDKYSLNMIDHLGTKYDYTSVMHYGPSAFSKNGKSTIEPVEQGAKIGQRVGFSDTDLFKINKLYNCPADQLNSNGVSSTQSVLPITVTKLPDGTIQNSGSCVDLRDDCTFLMQRGHCGTSFARLFMQVNCPMSCKYCISQNVPSPLPAECGDDRPWCPRFARNGACTMYLFKDYMRSRCALSCDVCRIF